jgi:hypothetical protein
VPRHRCLAVQKEEERLDGGFDGYVGLVVEQTTRKERLEVWAGSREKENKRGTWAR